jgi:TonB family protein
MRLFPFLCSIQLQDTNLNHLQASQAQRIDTSLDRSTLEQRRASPNAADAVFLASGEPGGHPERRPPAPVEARWGGLQRMPAQAGDKALRALTSARSKRSPGRAGEEAALLAPTTLGNVAVTSSLDSTNGSKRPAERNQAERGIDRGLSQRTTLAAKVQFARPDVDRGPAATTSVAEGRVQDDTDAELLAARLERSLVDASLQRSEHRGPGLGGAELTGAGIAPAGEGRGAKATPYLPGPGRVGVLDTSDSRYLRWFTNHRARVQNRLIFPEARALAKDQGTSLYRVAIRRNGTLSGPPVLLRSSGYPDFDAAAISAIERAAPFEPLPMALVPVGQEPLSLVIPVEFENPMIQ